MEVKLSKGDMVKWFFNLAIPIIIFMIPCNEIFTMQMCIRDRVEDAVYLAKLLNVDEQQLASLVAQRYAAVNPRADNHRTRFAKFARYNTQNQP